MTVVISATMLDDFIHCPQMVMYRIKRNIVSHPTREMILGTLMHSILEKSWESRDAAYARLNSAQEDYSLTKKEMTNLGFKLDIFFLNFRGVLTASDLIEQKFKFQIHDDVFITGKIDRICNGSVYDWKTGIIRSKNMSKNIQAMIYDYAYTKMFSEPPKSVCIASLANGQTFPYVRNPFYVKEVFDKIIPKLVKTIKAESYDRSGIFNGSCFGCVYKAGCLGEKNVMDSEPPTSE